MGLVVGLGSQPLREVSFLVGVSRATAYRARLSEVEGLKWRQHVQLDQGWLTLPGTKTRKARRKIPIGAQLREVLLAAPKGGDSVVRPWPNVRRGLASACRRARCPGDRRRLAATDGKLHPGAPDFGGQLGDKRG